MMPVRKPHGRGPGGTRKLDGRVFKLSLSTWGQHTLPQLREQAKIMRRDKGLNVRIVRGSGWVALYTAKPKPRRKPKTPPPPPPPSKIPEWWGAGGKIRKLTCPTCCSGDNYNPAGCLYCSPEKYESPPITAEPPSRNGKTPPPPPPPPPESNNNQQEEDDMINNLVNHALTHIVSTQPRLFEQGGMGALFYRQGLRMRRVPISTMSNVTFAGEMAISELGRPFNHKAYLSWLGNARPKSNIRGYWKALSKRQAGMSTEGVRLFVVSIDGTPAYWAPITSDIATQLGADGDLRKHAAQTASQKMAAAPVTVTGKDVIDATFTIVDEEDEITIGYF